MASAQKKLKRETARAGNGLTCVSLPEKQQFCQKLLADGRPKAFVELFQLTHTVDSEVIPAEVGNDARSVSQQRNVMFNLGKVYWKLQDSLKAINSFEDCLALARTNNNHGRAMLAAENLLEIYWKCAEQSKQVGDHLKSIEYFEKCVSMAKACQNLKLGGEAKYNIGLLYGLILQPSTSLKYFEDFLQLCYNMNDKEDMMMDLLDYLLDEDHLRLNEGLPNWIYPNLMVE